MASVPATDVFLKRYRIRPVSRTARRRGVIGAMAGIIGSVQALEAVKYFTGAGELLTNKMYVFDGLTMENRIVRFPNRNERCRVCGENADIKSVKGNAAEYRRKGCAIQSM